MATDQPGAGDERAVNPQATQQVLDAPELRAFYANFARVTGSPEELILDFGLNPNPFGTHTQPIHVQQRLVINFFTAKRLLAALSMAVQRHEQVFGVLETDIQKRVTPAARAAAAR